MTTGALFIEASYAERYYWRVFWHYRELFAVLARRDVAERYKQTVIGMAWVVAQPLASVLVFTLMFGKLAKLRAPAGVPYALMVFVGLLLWHLMNSAHNGAANGLIGNSGLNSKVYFRGWSCRWRTWWSASSTSPWRW